jgi:hypothetical protein
VRLSAPLLKANSCGSSALKTFHENLLRFTKGDDPAQGVGKPSLYSVCMQNVPRGRSAAEFRPFCRCLDRRYESVLTPAEKERYIKDYAAFEHDASPAFSGGCTLRRARAAIERPLAEITLQPWQESIRIAGSGSG